VSTIMKLLVSKSVRGMLCNYVTFSLLTTMLIHGGIHISNNNDNNGSSNSGSSISSILIEKIKKKIILFSPHRNKIKLYNSPTPS
jgi:hypothetical protein